MQALAEMREMTNSWVLGERRFKRRGWSNWNGE
jgi:hypothetical protein